MRARQSLPVALGLALTLAAAACSKDDPAPSGGVIVEVVAADLVVDELEIHVSEAGRPLFDRMIRIPADAILPNTLAIVGNGDPARSVDVSVIAYRAGGALRRALDRRDLAVRDIPRDHFVGLPIHLSAGCAALVSTDDLGNGQSRCDAGSTCDPRSSTCQPSALDAANDLGAYVPGEELRAAETSACEPRRKRCAGACVAIDDPAFGCGDSTCNANACPPAGTGVLACAAGACVSRPCSPGTKKCGDACVPTDAAHGCAAPSRCEACGPGLACAGSPAVCTCVDEPLSVTCATKCGLATNNCGRKVTCNSAATEVTCAGRCGKVTDNCTKLVICAPCPPRLVGELFVGKGELAVAFDPSTNKVWVTDDDQHATAFDGLTLSTTTVSVGRGPIAIATNSKTKRAYVANYGTGALPEATVTEIDEQTGLTTTIPVDGNPYKVAIDETRNLIWVAHYGFSGHTVSRIDGATRKATSIELGYQQPETLLLKTKTNQVLLSHVNGFVSRIDGDDGNKVTHFGSGARGGGLGLHVASETLYLTRPFSGPSSNLIGGKKVSIFDSDLGQLDIASGGVSPGGVAIHQKSNRVFVSNYDSATVSVIDGASRQVIQQIPVGKGPSVHIAVDEVHDLVFVLDQLSNDIAMIDAVTFDTVRTPLASMPAGLAVDPTARRVYVVDAREGDALGRLSVVQY